MARSVAEPLPATSAQVAAAEADALRMRHPLRLTAFITFLAYAGGAAAVLWRRGSPAG